MTEIQPQSGICGPSSVATFDYIFGPYLAGDYIEAVAIFLYAAPGLPITIQLYASSTPSDSGRTLIKASGSDDFITTGVHLTDLLGDTGFVHLDVPVQFYATPTERFLRVTISNSNLFTGTVFAKLRRP